YTLSLHDALPISHHTHLQCVFLFLCVCVTYTHIQTFTEIWNPTSFGLSSKRSTSMSVIGLVCVCVSVCCRVWCVCVCVCLCVCGKGGVNSVGSEGWVEGES